MRPVELEWHETQEKMNKTERRYADYLEMLKVAGEIIWYGYETLKIKLADRTTYTPDFTVVTGRNHLEFHEVKGWWRDDARVKIKIAAKQIPWARFIAVRAIPQKDGGGWEKEVFQ